MVVQVQRNQHALLRSVPVKQAYPVFRFSRPSPSHPDLFAFHKFGPLCLVRT
jgi:hypothetical protein